MEEVLPGVFHWLAEHPVIHVRVSSYWLADGGVLIDPLPPEDGGLGWFEGQETAPQAIVLSNRHHYRGSHDFVERFGCPVHVPRAGLHEFGPERQPVEPYEPGDSLPGGLVVHEVDAICPDDMALYSAERASVWFADGLVRGGEVGSGGPLGFVPDSLMDDPAGTKRGLLQAFERLLRELRFENVFLAHGGPVVGDGRALLEELVSVGGRTAFEM